MRGTKITQEEQKLLDSIRERKNKREECAKEINKILGKHECKIVVDPNSLVKDPQILVTNT